MVSHWHTPKEPLNVAYLLLFGRPGISTLAEEWILGLRVIVLPLDEMICHVETAIIVRTVLEVY